MSKIQYHRDLKNLESMNRKEFGKKYVLFGKFHKNRDGTPGGWVEHTARIAPTSYLSPSVSILGHARILGNAQILDYATVRDHAIVRDNVVVSHHAIIKEYAIISGAAKIMNQAMISQHAKVSGSAYVCDAAVVLGEAKVYEDCALMESCEVFGFAKVYGNCTLTDEAKVYGKAHVYGNSMIADNAHVKGNARVFENSMVEQMAVVYGQAKVFGDSEVTGIAHVFGNAKVSQDAKISGHAKIHGTAEIRGESIVQFHDDLSRGTFFDYFSEDVTAKERKIKKQELNINRFLVNELPSLSLDEVSQQALKNVLKSRRVHQQQRNGNSSSSSGTKQQLWEKLLEYKEARLQAIRENQRKQQIQKQDAFGNEIVNPVIGDDGVIYDRESLQQWFKKRSNGLYQYIHHRYNERGESVPNYKPVGGSVPLTRYYSQEDSGIPQQLAQQLKKALKK